MPAGKKWSSTEDEALSRAWAQSTANSANGADQTSAALWDSIKQLFERLAAGHQRSLNALRNRWTDIQHDVEARLADAMQRKTRIIEEQFVLGLFNQPTPDHTSGKRNLELLRATYLRMAEAEVVQGESGTPDVENAGESGSEGERREDAPRKRVRREISLGESALL
ncbi:TPA: hypothetical protein N0F65_007317 [Lagenidium giganteum]|uniref:Myb-like domain-containing protein n=1 Tax=Lagenidium giganteum TaxID=4803 RepID=A0AAV2Z6P1_9STRA|nr:TPA: hypothetical protein N0F65_007317 [Lagenidium giganteum]